MSEHKDWIVRFYANHNDVPAGHIDGEIQKELIRCKDCAHKKKCQWNFFSDDDNGFCAWAVRKEE